MTIFETDILYNYDPADLEQWGGNLKIEMKVANIEQYKNIALFHHVLLKKCNT